MATVLFILASICCVSYIQATPRMCLSHGKYYIIGDTYTDGCYVCVCEANGPVCKMGAHCINGRQIVMPTKCETHNKHYSVGQTYADGCDLCTCLDTGAHCQKWVLCIKRRQLSLTASGTCEVNGVSYKIGQRYQEGCKRCVCEPFGMICANGCETALGKRAASGACKVGDHTYHVGESWNDGCNACMCDRWGPICTANFCGGPVGKRATGNCLSNGITYHEGETFQRGCKRCSCGTFGLLCVGGCETPLGKREETCEEQVKASMSHIDEYYGCDRCFCFNNTPICHTSLVCIHKSTKRAATCTHSGKTYSEGDSYVRNCEECVCRGGNWKCDIYWMCELGR